MSAKLERNKTYGPYEVISNVSLEAPELVGLPWSEVEGCQIICAISDNYGQQATFTFARQFWATAEVAVWGSVQGYNECLKRQQVRMDSGPLLYMFDDEEAYDKVSIRARNMSGGRSGAAVPTNPTSPIAANGFYLKLTVFIQPRSGWKR